MTEQEIAEAVKAAEETIEAQKEVTESGWIQIQVHPTTLLLAHAVKALVEERDNLIATLNLYGIAPTIVKIEPITDDDFDDTKPGLLGEF